MTMRQRIDYDEVLIRPRRRQILIGFVALAAIIGIPWYFIFSAKNLGPLANLKSPQSLTIYSIDGVHVLNSPESRSDATDLFYGYPVLGKVKIDDAKARVKIIRALKASVYTLRGSGFAACFWPRHAIHAVEDGQAIDVIICF
jgi:hypothetical protein